MPIARLWTFSPVVVAAVVSTLCLSLPAGASAGSEVVGGGFVGDPCVPTSYVAEPADPTIGEITCVTSSQWTGTWTGFTAVRITARVNLVTGEVRGTATETLVGRASDGTTGTLAIADVFTVDANGYLHDAGTIEGGSGAWAGSKGNVTFEGYDSLGPGFGGYRGEWSRPGR